MAPRTVYHPTTLGVDYTMTMADEQHPEQIPDNLQPVRPLTEQLIMRLHDQDPFIRAVESWDGRLLEQLEGATPADTVLNCIEWLLSIQRRGIEECKTRGDASLEIILDAVEIPATLAMTMGDVVNTHNAGQAWWINQTYFAAMAQSLMNHIAAGAGDGD